jgi:hypothetical protein
MLPTIRLAVIHTHPTSSVPCNWSVLLLQTAGLPPCGTCSSSRAVLQWRSPTHHFLTFFRAVLRRCQCLDYIKSNDTVINETLIGNNVRGSGRGLIEALSPHLPGGITETKKVLSQDSRIPGRNSTRTPHKYKSVPLQLGQPSRSVLFISQ